MAVPTIYLTGAPASGKSTLGRRLAAALAAEFIDLDEEIVRAAGRSIPALFQEEGEPGFRAREHVALAACVEKSPAARVIALGGGTLLDETNRVLCEQSGVIICLETPSAEELQRRLNASAQTRPLGNKARERAAHYASFPRRLAAFFDLGESLVIVGENLAAPFLCGIPAVVDAQVDELYPDLARSLFVLPSGEKFKTPATVASIWASFAQAGLGRRDRVAAVGGGVTGDLTGFAAATWMRGIDWMNVPTTLLSMVDASTGGKTGCDLPEGKNLAGAFHAPKLVVIDTAFLKTLSAPLLAEGRAEMIKHEIIGGCVSPTSGVPSAAEVAVNLAVKVNLVREDPFERTGRRLLLNCGHTVAHAVEKATDYQVSHGAAVAIGCVEEARLAVRLGLASTAWVEELATRFATAGLPTELPAGLDFDSLRVWMQGDKKREGSRVTFALPCGWGDVRAVPVDLKG